MSDLPPPPTGPPPPPPGYTNYGDHLRPGGHATLVDASTGQPGIGVGRGVGRYFARWLSSIPLGLGYFWMLWDGRKQTWHDKLVGSLVVKA